MRELEFKFRYVDVDVEYEWDVDEELYQDFDADREFNQLRWELSQRFKELVEDYEEKNHDND